MSRRILHIVGGGEFGGAERYLIDLARHLPQSEFRPLAATFYESRFTRLLREAGLPVYVVPNRGRYDWRSTAWVSELLRREGVDLVHTHGVRASFFARLAARRLGIPVVTTVHSLLRLDYPDWPSRFMATFMEGATRRLTDRFLPVSQALRDELVRSGVPGRKVRVVHGGIEYAAFRQAVEASRRGGGGAGAADRQDDGVREELGLAPSCRLVGMVARLHPVKGHRVLLAAARRLQDEWPAGQPEIHYLLVGEGHWGRGLREMCQALGLAGRVHFLGFRSDVPRILAALDVYAAPSLWEGLGLSLLEAMAAGVPCVASRVGGIPDVVRDGENGLLFPPGDAAALAAHLRRLVLEPALGERLAAQAARDVASHFTVQRLAGEVAEVYRELIAGSRRGAGRG